MSDCTHTRILDKARETVYGRSEQHGEPEDSFARIAEMWSAYLDVTVESHEVADLMVLLKVARNAEGVYHADNYVDLAGYAECGARLHEETVDGSVDDPVDNGGRNRPYRNKNPLKADDTTGTRPHEMDGGGDE